MKEKILLIILAILLLGLTGCSDTVMEKMAEREEQIKERRGFSQTLDLPPSKGWNIEDGFPKEDKK